MDLEARQNLAEELRAECERFRTENAVFESYLQRVNPPTVNGVTGGEEREDATSPSARKLANSSKKAKTKPNAQASMKIRDLSTEERYDIVTSEMEIIAGGGGQRGVHFSIFPFSTSTSARLCFIPSQSARELVSSMSSSLTTHISSLDHRVPVTHLNRMYICMHIYLHR